MDRAGDINNSDHRIGDDRAPQLMQLALLITATPDKPA